MKDKLLQRIFPHWYADHTAIEKAIDHREAKVEDLSARLRQHRRDNGFGQMFGHAGLGGPAPKKKKKKGRPSA